MVTILYILIFVSSYITGKLGFRFNNDAMQYIAITGLIGDIVYGLNHFNVLCCWC